MGLTYKMLKAGKVFTNTNSGWHGSLIGNKQVKKFSIKLLINTNLFMIGYSPNTINAKNGNANYFISGYYIYCNGGTLYAQNSIKSGSPYASFTALPDDIIGATYNKVKGEIHFYRNGKCLGLAFSGLKNQKLYPTLCCYGTNTSAKIVKGVYKN